RNQADEHVGEDELSANAPQQAALRDDAQAKNEERGTGGGGEPGHGVDDTEERGHRTGDPRQQRDDDLEGEPDDNRAPGQRVQERSRETCSAISGGQERARRHTWTSVY